MASMASSSSSLWSPDHLRKLQAWEDEQDAGDLPRLTKRDMLSKQKQIQHQQQKQRHQLGLSSAPRGGGPAGGAGALRPPPPVAHQYSSCIFGPTSPASHRTSNTAATTVASSSTSWSSPPMSAPPSLDGVGGTASLRSGSQPSTAAMMAIRNATREAAPDPRGPTAPAAPVPALPPRRTSSFASMASVSTISGIISPDATEGGGSASPDFGPAEFKRVTSLPPQSPSSSSPSLSAAPMSPSSFDLNKILCFPSTLFQFASSTGSGEKGKESAQTTRSPGGAAATTARSSPARKPSLFGAATVTPPRQNAAGQESSSSPGTAVPLPAVTAPFSPHQLVVLDDLRHLLAGKSKSEAFEFLQHMVVDLMREVDSTNDALEEKVEKWKKRQAIWIEQRGEVADCVAAALQKHVNDGGRRGNLRSKKRLLHQLAVSPPASSSSSKASLALSSKPIVEGMNLVLDHITEQLSQMQKENEKLQDKVQQLQSKIDDLGGVAESRLFKIEALEHQFVALNASRGNLAKKLVDKTNQIIKLSGRIPRIVSVQTTSADDNVEVVSVHAASSDNDNAEVQQAEDEEEEDSGNDNPATVVEQDDPDDDGYVPAEGIVDDEEDEDDDDDNDERALLDPRSALSSSCPGTPTLSVD